MAIMILTVVAAVVDFVTENYVDTFIDLLFGSMTFLAYRYLFFRQNIEYAAIALFWISAFIELLYLMIHSVDFNIIFAMLIPIIAFIALSRRLIIWNLALYYIVLILFLGYYYSIDRENLFLHNSAYMIAYTMAHLFILAFGIFYYLAIDESLKRLEASNRSQTLLLNEVHHRVKNNLNLISSILGLQTDKTDIPEQRQLLEENQRRIESMAILHEILYSHGTITSADLKEYVQMLVAHIISSSLSEKLEVKTDILPITLPMGSMIQLGIMLNEMMTNSIKHLSRSKETIRISIVFEQWEEGYRLYYCDNASHVDTRRLEQGFGYNLIMLTARHFNAKVTYDISEGLCYSVVFENLEGR
jgi:two-component sensor histidine kinase